MNLTARMVDELSLWEWQNQMQGWLEHNGAEHRPESLTEEEHDALVAKLG